MAIAYPLKLERAPLNYSIGRTYPYEAIAFVERASSARGLASVASVTLERVLKLQRTLSGCLFNVINGLAVRIDV